MFFNEKLRAHRMAILFGLAGLNCAELHGSLSQNQSPPPSPVCDVTDALNLSRNLRIRRFHFCWRRTSLQEDLTSMA